jgi:hypothetical protein
MPAGTRGGTPFEEIAPSGGTLVGFDLYEGRFGANPTAAGIRPIYQCGKAYVHGGLFGTAKASPKRLLARPGFIVGGLKFRAGLMMDGMQVVFVRAERNGAVSNDRYESEWVGNQTGGGAFEVPVQGGWPVGICGATGPELKSLGLVWAP